MQLTLEVFELAYPWPMTVNVWHDCRIRQGSCLFTKINNPNILWPIPQFDFNLHLPYGWRLFSFHVLHGWYYKCQRSVKTKKKNDLEFLRQFTMSKYCAMCVDLIIIEGALTVQLPFQTAQTVITFSWFRPSNVINHICFLWPKVCTGLHAIMYTSYFK